MQISKKPYAIERILSCLTYLTTGFIGFIWLIIAALTKKRVTDFLMYHILQSIFISLIYFVLEILASMLYVILYKIPIINAIPYYLNLRLPMFLNLSVIQLFTTTIVLYLAITAAMGFYSYLPWVSNIIKSNTNRN